jgi:hypothetical protein
VGNYERAVAQACKKYGIEFWVDMELFHTDDSHALADSARISAQLDTAYAAGAIKAIAYDLAVLGNAGLDSLEKWKLKSSVEPPEGIVAPRENRHASHARDEKSQKRELFLNGRLQNSRSLNENSQYFKANGAKVKQN